MSDSIRTAAERIKEDALQLAERAREEAVTAFASVNDNRDELRAKAAETAKLAGTMISENARVASDLARKNASAAAHIVSENAKQISDELGPMRDRAEQALRDGAERLGKSAHQVSDRISANGKYAADQARAHPVLAAGLAVGGIAMLVAAASLMRRRKPAPATDASGVDTSTPTNKASSNKNVPPVASANGAAPANPKAVDA
ncbi:hypothetical protein [Blastomonas sp.]|uniref:hypothetical protein n=1 Tax=Blastomonas sp. TaxID=1909299 RepID=UPI0035948C24